MKLYNSLTHDKQDFITNEPGKVSMYTCGPTVYHFAHIGNLRSYIMEDVLEKYLRYTGYDVKRVMNITDVGHLTSDADEGEDKMLKGAKREHKTVLEIAKFYPDIKVTGQACPLWAAIVEAGEANTAGADYFVHKRITQLPPFDRAIILLWLENMSYDEIGAIVGISPKNVSVRLFRIKEKLKEMATSQS